MYRPTVRYDDVYKRYVDNLFQATQLDRNQIIRMGLFLLGHTSEGQALLSEHLKKDVPLPRPTWGPAEHGLWRNQTWQKAEGVGTSGLTNELAEEGRHAQGTRRERPVYKSEKGAITIRLD